MRTDDNYGATVPYEPNSFGEWKDSPELKEPPLEVHGDVFNYDEREYDSDYYTQPGKTVAAHEHGRPQGHLRQYSRTDGRCPSSSSNAM